MRTVQFSNLCRRRECLSSVSWSSRGGSLEPSSLSGGYVLLRIVTVLTVLVVFFGTGQTALGSSNTNTDRIASQQARAKSIICKVFGPYCQQALSVSWCESKWYVWAGNGQYLGIFQMGNYARSKYGHGSGAWKQARAAKRYFIESGRDWSPWTCKP